MLSSELRKLSRGYIQVPYCSWERVETCIKLLRDAGVAGEIEVEYLTAERADLDGFAGRVTATQPRAGDLLAPDAGIKVWVNPGAPEELSDEDKDRIARGRSGYERQREEPELIFRERPRAQPNVYERPPVRQPLTEALLERFDERLREEGALLADAWAPGLTYDQIDELLEPVGIELPEEARMWWRWHNGTRDDAPEIARALAWRWPTSLEYAIEWYEQFRQFDVQWGVDGLLMPFGEKPTIYFDCSGPRDLPVPVWAQYDYTEAPRPELGSIGELVALCLAYLDQGVWKVDPDGAIRIGDLDKRLTISSFL